MKRQWRQTVLLAATGCLLWTGSAMAATVVFQDDDIYFPGYEFGVDDQIINPAVGDMTVIFDDSTRQLLSVSLQISNRIVWDTLFINTNYTANAPDAWNYVVLDTSGLNSNITPTYTPIPDYTTQATGLYTVNNVSPNPYTFATSGRTGHPDGINPVNLGQFTALTTGGYGNQISYFNNAVPSLGRNWDTLTYDFSNLEITLGDNYAIAYSPWCANDVTLAVSAVPEPTAALLIGAGLFGLIGINRKQSVKA